MTTVPVEALGGLMAERHDLFDLHLGEEMQELPT